MAIDDQRGSLGKDLIDLFDLFLFKHTSINKC